MKLVIRNGRAVDAANGLDAVRDIYISDGVIQAVAEQGKQIDGYDDARVLDASGKVVAAGLVDLSARLREPGYEYKATL
ncbi:MAG TPA: dihydroorotase, partial [Burkholderiaceae bacterium]